MSIRLARLHSRAQIDEGFLGRFLEGERHVETYRANRAATQGYSLLPTGMVPVIMQLLVLG